MTIGAIWKNCCIMNCTIYILILIYFKNVLINELIFNTLCVIMYVKKYERIGIHMNYLIQKTFENRGYTTEWLREINNPEYDELKDIDLIAVRLKEIHDNNIPITIFPDFDVDGISSGNCSFAGLAELGFKVNLFIPNPEHGYGLSPAVVDDIMKAYPDTKVIFTCDNGISCYDAADYCNEIGVELIVTDHHVQTQEINTAIVVDPMRMDETYSHPNICGAFVVYQVLQRYADLYCNYFLQDQIRRLRVFAGIGTVSDTMPLWYENRQIVRDSIDIIRLIYGNGDTNAVMAIQGCDIYRRAFWGLFYIMKSFEEHGKIRKITDIDEEFFSYYFVPTFNSTKRMNGDMTKPFGVFFADTAQIDMEYLYQLNTQRKILVAKEYKAIYDRDQPYAPYVYITDAPAGILGLLATNIMKVTGLPTFVVNDEGDGHTNNRFHGSGRSPEWYPCMSNLANVDGIGIAGHECAFGCSIDSQTKLTKFIAFLDMDIARVQSEIEIVEEKPDFVIATDWSADIGIDLNVFAEYLEELEQWRPFGKGFPAPNVKLIFKNNDVKEWKNVGSANEHLKVSLHQGFDIMCWHQGASIAEKDLCDEHVVYGHLDISDYRGESSIQFVGNMVKYA